jgi:hypothetical protein
MSLTDRFWDKVDKTDGCWLWTAATNGGYGIIGTRKHASPVRAHRVSWEIAFGPIPEGLFVCHNCDANYPVGDKTYRRCVRPDHLFLGTVLDNQRDMALKGRAARGDRNGARLYPERLVRYLRPDQIRRGEQSPLAKLTEASVRDIRSRYASGINQYELADQFGVTQSSISMIVNRRVWAHV